MIAKRMTSWLLGVSIGFAFFTICIQMLVGMSTGQNFLEIPWDGSMFLAGILSIVASTYESLET